MNPQEEEQRVKEENKSRNLDIVNKFKSFFDRFPSETNEYNPNVQLLRFQERAREDRKVWLKINPYDREEEVEDFENVPPNFQPPVYLVYPLYFNEGAHGGFHPLMGFSFKGKVYPEWIIGSDGKAYKFDNDYYFDATGQAIKLEDVSCQSDLEGMEPEELLELQLPGMSRLVQRFDFELSEKKVTRTVDLDEGDYERIEAYIKGIELGQFELEAPPEEA